MAHIGVVVIGRNEGQRLARCLASVLRQADAVVYVDSCSTDDSVRLARANGVEVLELDLSVPMTAARARNAGFMLLTRRWPDVAFVQFVDGDCDMADGWLERATQVLQDCPDVAVVCGNLRERHPRASIYNLLCTMEWSGSPGDVEACGGNALMRVEAFRGVAGFRDHLMAGEEPELCLRLRAAGWKIRRLSAAMGLHDAAMTHFGQWWRRAVRAGHAFAECSWLHRFGPLRLWNRQVRSNWFWGLLLPLGILGGLFFGPCFGFLLLAYSWLTLRIYKARRSAGDPAGAAFCYAIFCVIAKFAHVVGQARFHGRRLLCWPTATIARNFQGRGESPDAPLTIAYLVNQYPHVSHSFIRREIRALERHGLSVQRFTIRRIAVRLVDPDDLKEQHHTTALLDVGVLGLALACAMVAIAQPWRVLCASLLALKLGWRSGRGCHRHLAYLAEACVLIRQLQCLGVRHIHSHFGTNATDVALLAHAISGLDYSFTVHGPEEFDRPEQLSLREKIRDSAFVVAISDFGRAQLLRWCPLEDWAKVHVVRCGVDQDFLAAGPQAMEESNRLVCVGRLCEQKGQALLVEAVARLGTEGTPCDLVLAGDGPMRPAIEAEIARRGLQGQIRVTGWLSNAAVRSHIWAARAMVLPSFAEGLPVVFMEALALGRPVITTCVAGHPELIEPGQNGWLVPAGSVEALVGALRQALATSSDRLLQMGREGARRVALLHDADQQAARLAALFAGTRRDSGKHWQSLVQFSGAARAMRQKAVQK